MPYTDLYSEAFYCRDCGATWEGERLLRPGNRFGNAMCQSCGYDARTQAPAIFHPDDFNGGLT